MKFLIVVIVLLVALVGYGQYRSRAAKAEKARAAFVRDSTTRAESLKVAEAESLQAVPAGGPRAPVASIVEQSPGPQERKLPRPERKVVTQKYGPTNRKP